MARETEYVTTAIVYPNSRIHIGWAWECLGADWLARSLRLLGRDTFFATGMDEHSVNVQRAAEAQGLDPKTFCDRMAEDIRRVLDQMGLTYGRFIRTSDEDHHRVVEELVRRVHASGDIYKAKYEGHYCEGCEAYYTEKDLVGGLCPHHKKPTRWLSEENYFFKLSKYQERLLALYDERPEFIQPVHRRAEIVNFVKAGLKDFSVSRSSFTWGIPLPFDRSQVIYVWFDALINYLTAAGIEAWLKDPASPGGREFLKRWPASVHVIGLDISRFHTVYWPAMLMAMGLPLPEKVFVHGWITLKGERMSKSSGNVVTPDEVMARTGPDPLRYYLLSENQFGGEGNFAWEALILRNNADLSNDWGNLVNRSLSMTRKYFPDEEVGPPTHATHSAEVRAQIEGLIPELERAVAAVDTAAYSAACSARSRALNLYIDRMKPWAMAKDPAHRESLREVMFTLLEGVRWTAAAFQPLLPFGMPEVFRQLGVSSPDSVGALKRLRWGERGFRPGAPKPIYPRLELPAGG